MMISRLKFAAGSLLFACLTSVVLCVLPRDPSDPSNAEVSPVIKNSQGVVVYHSAVDSIFRTVEIGVALHLPEYFDSVKIEISAEGEAIEAVILKDIDSLQTDDTIWYSMEFETAGVKNVLITPYSTVVQLKPVTALIVIAPSATGENNAPKLTYSGTTILAPGDICQLTLSTSDDDSGQTVTVALAEMLTNTILNGNAFTWVPPASFIGTQTIKFTATDNGTPAKSTQLEVEIIITATPHPPTLSIDGRNNVKPGEICSLSIVTGDIDAGQTVVVSMTGAPADAQLTHGAFIWKAPDVASVEYEITFTATDNGNPPLSTNSVVKVTVASSTSVNTAPKWDVDTIGRALNDTGKIVLSLAELCKDAENDLRTYSLLDGFPEDDAIASGEYRYTATSAAIGTHYAKIAVTDPSGLADTLVVKITVENIINDVTPPVITLITPSETATTINSASFTIDALCSDPSGISSAIALYEGKEFLAVVADDHYKMTVTGLKSGVENEITISVKDAAPAKNEATKVITVRYIKPEITALELVAPAAGASGVDTLPTFSWNGGDGSTGTDTVKYQVRYGTSSDNFSEKSGILTTRNFMLASAKKLNTRTAYFWQVVAWSASVTDTVKSSVQTFITFDPTATDTAGPTITQLSGVKNGERVKSANSSTGFSISDISGIDSVWWTLNGATPTVAPAKQGDGSYLFNYGSLPYGTNKIKVFARDKATTQNSASVEIVFTYNTEIAPVTPLVPANGASGISTSPSFTWSGGDDADGDSVFFIVKYGTAANALTSALPAVLVKTTSVPPANALDANKSYFWMVVAYSKVNGDTVKSAVHSFTTIGSAPSITTVTIPASVNIGDPLSLSVTATGNPQPTSYQWYLNNAPISSATNATYSKTSAGAADTGMYYVKVSNGVSDISSTPSHLDVKGKITFNSNLGSTVDPQMVSLGSKASAPSPSPTRTGFKFLGWFTSESAAAEFGFTTTAITGNITLIAKWVAVYSVKYHANNGTGSVPVDPKEYVSGDLATVLEKPVNLSLSNFEFQGWNTSATGTGGVLKLAGEYITIASSSITFYAVWTPAKWTVSYNGDQATVAAEPTFKVVEHSTSVGTLPIQPQKASYVFDGWYTGLNGTGSSFVSTTPVTANITIYAKWVIKDVEGNKYTEVKVGTQTWMVENLKVTKYNDGSLIPYLPDASDWSSTSSGAYCWSYNDASVKNTCGALYNMYAIVDSRKIAPIGWHVPTQDDWNTFFSYLIANGYNYDGSTTDAIFGKAIASTTGWSPSSVVGSPGNDPSSNDRAKFSLYPGGFRYGDDGEFRAFGDVGYLWSSTPFTTPPLYWVCLQSYDNTYFNQFFLNEKCGLSIRCIKD